MAERIAAMGQEKYHDELRERATRTGVVDPSVVRPYVVCQAAAGGCVDGCGV